MLDVRLYTIEQNGFGHRAHGEDTEHTKLNHTASVLCITTL